MIAVIITIDFLCLIIREPILIAGHPFTSIQNDDSSYQCTRQDNSSALSLYNTVLLLQQTVFYLSYILQQIVKSC